MKKTLLSLLALSFSLGIGAQETESTQQRIVGYYTTDDYDATYGTGLAGYGEYDKARAAIYLNKDILQYYDGAKIVGLRFALSNALLDKATAFVAGVSADGIDFTNPIVGDGVIGEDLVAEETASAPSQGWNTVTFSKPVTISKDQELVAGFKYAQKATAGSIDGYTSDCWPLSCEFYGRADLPLLVYYNIPAVYGGNGEGWYSLGSSNGNLSVQLIVEGNFPDYCLIPEDIGTVNATVGKASDLKLEIFNNSASSVLNYNYVMKIDGTTLPEYTAQFIEDLPSGQRDFLEDKIPALIEAGTHEVSIEITQVEGNDNLATRKIATGKVIVTATSGIDDVTDGKVSEISRYAADGTKISSSRKGLNIIKFSNGKTVKTVVK